MVHNHVMQGSSEILFYINIFKFLAFHQNEYQLRRFVIFIYKKERQKV